MSDAFCYNIGDLLVEAKEKGACAGADCVGVLLPREKETLLEYVSSEYMDRRTVEVVRCLVQNAMKDKRDRSIRQFASIPRRVLTGRINPSRNLLTDVHNYEQCGVGMVSSDARIMGGVAAVLRCNITDFNLDAILRLINDTKWRVSMHFNQAQEQEMTALLGVFHAYIVGTLCGNPARTWSPNVAYTYGMYGSQCPKTRRRNFCVMMEKVPGLPRQESVGAMLKSGRMTPELFLSVFYQLALTLEGMQSWHGFCHSDLHVDKVALRPVYRQSGDGTSWSYLLYGSQHTLHNIQFFATLHDYRYGCFDHALATTGVLGVDDKFVGTGTHRRQGIVGFMVPGQDMFSFLHSARRVVVGTLDPNNIKSFLVDPYAQENNLRVLHFVEYAIKEFYEAPPNQLSANSLLCKGAGVPPLQLVERVARSGAVKSILGVEKDPLQASARASYTPVLPDRKCVPLFLEDLLPHWQDAVPEPPALLAEKDLVPTIDTLLNMIKNKQVLLEFDCRPLMTEEGLVARDTLEYYDKLIFYPDGYYHGYYENTKTFYNKAQLFLNTYYYKHHIKDKAFIQACMEDNDKATALLRALRQPQFMPKVAGVVRFCQTIRGVQSASERNFCCIKKKETLGKMGRNQQDRLYQISSETRPSQCGRQRRQQQQQLQKQQPKPKQQQQVQLQKKKLQVATSPPPVRKQQAPMPLMVAPPPAAQAQQKKRRQQQAAAAALVPQAPAQAAALVPQAPVAPQRRQQAAAALVPQAPAPVAAPAQAAALVPQAPAPVAAQTQQQKKKRQQQAAAAALVPQAPAPAAVAAAPVAAQTQQQKKKRLQAAVATTPVSVYPPPKQQQKSLLSWAASSLF